MVKNQYLILRIEVILMVYNMFLHSNNMTLNIYHKNDNIEDSLLNFNHIKTIGFGSIKCNIVLYNNNYYLYK